MRVEFVNRNTEGFEHYHLLPTVELLMEAKGADFVIGEGLEYDWEFSLGITFLNLTLRLVW